MGNLRYRKDNKKLLIWVYIAFAAIIISSLIVNILNTKNVINMYILLAVFATSILLYFIFYIIHVRRNKEPLQLEDNYLAFYVSFNRNNKKIKKLMLLIDLIELLVIVGVANYYIIKMKMNEVCQL